MLFFFFESETTVPECKGCVGTLGEVGGGRKQEGGPGQRFEGSAGTREQNTLQFHFVSKVHLPFNFLKCELKVCYILLFLPPFIAVYSFSR